MIAPLTCPSLRSPDTDWIRIRTLLAMKRLYEGEIVRINGEIAALNDTAGRTT